MQYQFQIDTFNLSWAHSTIQHMHFIFRNTEYQFNKTEKLLKIFL